MIPQGQLEPGSGDGGHGRAAGPRFQLAQGQLEPACCPETRGRWGGTLPLIGGQRGTLAGRRRGHGKTLARRALVCDPARRRVASAVRVAHEAVVYPSRWGPHVRVSARKAACPSQGRMRGLTESQTSESRDERVTCLSHTLRPSHYRFFRGPAAGRFSSRRHRSQYPSRPSHHSSELPSGPESPGDSEPDASCCPPTSESRPAGATPAEGEP